MYRDYVCSPGSPGSVYVVQPGDSLWRIASIHLGNATRWPEIAELNGLRQPYTLFVGQRLYLPPRRPELTPSSSGSSGVGGAQCVPGPTLDPRPGAQPALQVEHAPVKLKLDKDIPVIRVAFPGGEFTTGFKGELIMHRMAPLPVTVTRDGMSAEYESSQKAWAADRYLELFNSVGLSVDRRGALTVVARTGLATEWYKGTFEINPNGSLKYEVEPKPVESTYKDVKLTGTIGCWIEIKPDFRLDPGWELQPTVVVNQRALLGMLTVAFFAYGAAAVTTAGAGASTMSFGQFLNMVLRGFAGTASSFMLILVPPGVLQEFNRQNGRPNSSDYSI